MPTVKLISVTPDYMKILGQAAGECYSNKVGPKGIEHIIKSGHLSVLEHCYATFEIECSTRVLGQITRHRHFSFTVKSTRGNSEYTVNDIVVPEGIKTMPESQERYEMVTQFIMGEYKKMIDSGVSPEDAAYLLPQGVGTKYVITGNFRSFFEYFPKRLCLRALPEHRLLAQNMHQELSLKVPEIFNREFLSCENCNESGCSYK